MGKGNPLTNYAWRSDLDRIEVLSETEFLEYTKDGFSTAFRITLKEPLKRLEFDIQNANMQGHWIGLFPEQSLKDGQYPPAALYHAAGGYCQFL